MVRVMGKGRSGGEGRLIGATAWLVRTGNEMIFTARQCRFC